MSRRLDGDVVVLGAGLSGLAAARRIVAGGRTVVVLEARERVGGRVHDHRLPSGDAVELGGQYCTPAHFGTVANHAVIDLAAEVGVDVFPAHGEGDKLLRWRGSTFRYSGRHRRALSLRHLPGALEFLLARWRLDRLARRINVGAPWAAAGARRLDAQTLGGWAERTLVTRSGKALLRLASETVYGADPAELSRLHAALHLSSNGTFGAMMGTSGKAQSHRFAGGPQLVAERVAAELGDAVLLAEPVVAVRWSAAGGVEVESSLVRVRARRAIVAMTPLLAARIAWQPGLPQRDQLAQRMPHGQAMKLLALYDAPFWREAGLNGQAATDGLIRVVFDDSPRDGSCGVLSAFAVGRAALRLAGLTRAERHRATTEALAALFGPRAARPQAIVEHDWTGDPWTRGGYGCYGAPAAWTTLGHCLRAPVGPLHWAGTETATVGMGSMSGAVLSGRRAADEALAALDGG